MAEAITSLTLEINTQSVDEANKKLDAFSKKAEDAASATDELTAAKKRSLNVTDEELKDFERVYQNAVKGAKASRIAAEQERKLATARKQLVESGDKLYTSFRNQIDGLKNVSTASKELEKISSRLRESYKSGAIDINNYNQLLSDVAVKQKEVTIAETLATKAKTDFINKLKAQVASQNLTKEQLLSYQAAQLGVSSSADIYIKKIAQASTATQNYTTATRTATNQAAKMQMQLMRGNFSGMNSLGMSMIMKNGIGSTFSTLLTSLNPLNIGISAMVGLLGSMIPKLFETENATEKLADAHERLNKVFARNKDGAIALSDEIAKIARRDKKRADSMILNAKFSAEKVVKESVNSLNKIFNQYNSYAPDTSRLPAYFAVVLDSVSKLKKEGVDLNQLMKDVSFSSYQSYGHIKIYSQELSEQLGITEDSAISLISMMSDIKQETDKIKAAEKLAELSEKLQDLNKSSGGNNENLRNLVSIISEITESALEGADVLSLFKNKINALSTATNNFERWRRAGMSPTERAAADIAQMRKDAYEINKHLKPTDKGYITDDEMKKIEAGIKASSSNGKTKGNHFNDLLQSSRQQEISLMNQLKSLREQSLTVNTITSERKKYFDLQAQIEVLESKTDKSKLTAQEKYILGHKEALLAQQAKNAALSEEIAQYETATKALRKMQEYSTNLVAKSLAEQATFGMTSKNAGRYNEMSELNAQRDIALKGTGNPNEIAKVTEEYNKAKEALQQSWQLEDKNQGDWLTGLKVGMCEFAEDGQNVFKGFRDVANNAMSSISSALTDLVTTGKMNFKSLTKSILTNIIEIINKLLVAQAIQSAMGWMGGGSGGGGAGAATGGYQQAYTGGLIYGYANGGGVGYSDEPGGFTGIGNKYQPAGIVHKGEFVFTKEATKRLGVANLYTLMREAQHGYANGGGVNLSPATPVAFTKKSNNSSSAINVTTNVAINMQSNSTSQAQTGSIDGRALEAQIKPIIQKNIGEALQKSTSPGGDLYILLNR